MCVLVVVKLICVLLGSGTTSVDFILDLIVMIDDEIERYLSYLLIIQVHPTISPSYECGRKDY